MYSTRNLIDIILVSIIILLLLSNGCNNEEQQPTYIKGKDSIVVKHTHSVDSISYPVPYKVLKVDTVRDTVTLVELDSIRLYENYNRDSSVLVQSEVRGLLLGSIIHAELKEKNIYRTDTIKLPCATKQSLRPMVFVNLMDSTLTMGIGGVYTNKRSTIVGGYNINNKSITVGYGFNLSK